MREALLQKYRIYRQLCKRYNWPLASTRWRLCLAASWPLSNSTPRKSRTAVSLRERCACIARSSFLDLPSHTAGLWAMPPLGGPDQLFYCAGVAHALREAHFWIFQIIQLVSEPHRLGGIPKFWTAVSLRERYKCIARRPIEEGDNDWKANLPTLLPLAERQPLKCLQLWMASPSALTKHVKTICAKNIVWNLCIKSV